MTNYNGNQDWLRGYITAVYTTYINYNKKFSGKTKHVLMAYSGNKAYRKQMVSINIALGWNNIF